MTNQMDRERFLQLCKKYLVVLPIVLVSFALFLAIMHHAVWQYGIDKENRWAKICFNLDGERTIPAWFASMQWFLVALAALLAYSLERAREMKKWLKPWWLVIACVFLVASADESAILHENVGLRLQPVFESRGLGRSVWGYFNASPWLVFYVLPLFTFIGISLVFLADRLREQQKVLYTVIAGFSCYVTALVLEFVQGMPNPKLDPIANFCGVTSHIFYTRTVLIEETLENLGTTALIMAILYYCYVLAEQIPRPELAANQAKEDE